jgi:hypothetical protein
MKDSTPKIKDILQIGKPLEQIRLASSLVNEQY